MSSGSLGLPFRMRPDLHVTPVEWAGERLYVVKDPLALRYFHLPAAQYTALHALQECDSLSDWSDRLAEGPESPTRTQLRAWLQEFLRWGLVTRERWVEGTRPAGHASSLWSRLGRFVRNPLYLQFPGCDPEPWLRPLHRSIGGMLSPVGVTVTVVFALCVWLFTLVHFATFMERLPDWSVLQDGRTWCSIWLAIGVTKIIHELAHGLAARRQGAECHALGLALILFSPALYCDVSDAWRLPRRWPRMAIALAGIWAETVMGAMALCLWWWTRPGLLHDWFWHVTAVSSVATLLVNLNPLARYDGYFLLCDALGLPNLRQQADAVVEQDLRQCLHGADHSALDRPLPLRLRLGLWSYALGSAGYRVFMIITMGYGLAAFLAPVGLSSLTWLYAASAVGSTLWLTVRRGQRVLSGGRGLRPVLISLMGLLLCTAGAWGALTIPIAWPESARFTLEPTAAQAVYVTTPGELLEVVVEAGDVVTTGQVLAVLQNPELERQRIDLLVRCAQQEQLVELARVQQQPGIQQEAQAALNTLAEQLAEVERRLERLVLTAPCDGSVLPPLPTPATAEHEIETTLPHWSGTLLEPANRGAYLAAGTCVLNVVPDQQPRAIVALEQNQRRDIVVGSEVDLQPTGQPRQRWSGTITEISPRAQDATPTHSSMPDITKTYASTVEIQGDITKLPVGTTGLARFGSTPRTLWQRGCETVRRALPAVW